MIWEKPLDACMRPGAFLQVSGGRRCQLPDSTL